MVSRRGDSTGSLKEKLRFIMFDEFSGVNILLMADFQGTKVLITSFQIPKDIAFYFRYKSALIISVRVEGGLICLLVRLLQLASSPSLSVLES